MRSSVGRFGDLVLAGLCAPIFAFSACAPVNDLPLGDASGGGGSSGQTATSAGGSAGQTSPGSAGSSSGGTANGGAIGGGAPYVCDPLAPVTSAVTLDASDLIAAGTDVDGTVYILSGKSGTQRLFVGSSSAVAEEPEAGTGETNENSETTWVFDYNDDAGMQIAVEAQQSSSGLRMGVVKGNVSGKTFDIGSSGSVLTLMAAATAAAIPATTTATSHIEYTGSSPDGTVVFLVAPDHDFSFDNFKLFFGPTNDVQQIDIMTIGRSLSIPTRTTVDFTTSKGPYVLSFTSDSPNATLSLGVDLFQLTGTAPYAVPPRAVFSCDGPAPATCSDLPGAALIAATPRENTNLEQLALKFSDTPIADQSVYARVVRDVGAIQAANPTLADITYFARDDGKTLLVSTDAATLTSMQSGSYHAWDCLNSAYGSMAFTFNPGSSPSVEITLKGIYQLTKLGQDYVRLPGIASAGPSTGGGDGSTICVTREQDTWHYVFDRASGDCIAGCTNHEYHHFTTTAAGAITDLGTPTAEEVASFASDAACN